MEVLNKKGMMGIGALIIFIAVILIAAIAASVLITTGGSLQQKALITGSQTEESIASGIDVMTVVAADASSSDPEGTPNRVGDFKLMVRLQSGSQGLNLNNTLLTVDTEMFSRSLVFNTTIDTDRVSTATSSYVAYYVQRGTSHEQGYLNRGDVAKIIFRVEPEIRENELVRIKLIPRIGTYTQVDFYTPDSMTQASVSLWPT